METGTVIGATVVVVVSRDIHVGHWSKPSLISHHSLLASHDLCPSTCTTAYYSISRSNNDVFKLASQWSTLR